MLVLTTNGPMASILDDSDDEGEVPPLLDQGAAARPSVPSIPRATPPASSAAAPPVPSGAAPSRPTPAPGANLKPNNGLKKGFLSGGPARKQKPSSDEAVPTVRANAAAKAKSLELPELAQAAQAEAAKVGGGGGNSWMTPELLQKIASKPLLRKAFTDPRYQAAMTEMQTNPQAAMQKYADVPEMREFLQSFMALMGEHFGALADKQEEEKRASEAAQPVLTPEQQKAQDVAQRAMADPEVREIIADPRIQKLLQDMQSGRPFELDAAARSDPDVVRKLRKLSAAGLIGMEWKP